jgi:hypothetical protein
LIIVATIRWNPGMRRLVVVLPAVVLLAVPAAGSARKAQDTFFNSSIPLRVDTLIGFTPTTLAIHPPTQPLKPIQVRVGGRTYRFIFGNAAAAVGPNITLYLRNMTRTLRYPSPQGAFVDRGLTARERRVLKVRADLGRDADVLAVTRDHPACASGVSRAAARGIAAGTIRRWSDAGVPTPASGDRIALRRASNALGDLAEPRFGATYKTPTGARRSRDGGLGEAASGDTSIAAVTSWSRARSFSRTTCAVPIGGAAPTDETVRALTHPDAYPITFVAPRWKGNARITNAITAAFVKYLTGPRATSAFAQRGMLPATGEWPAIPDPAPQPPPEG